MKIILVTWQGYNKTAYPYEKETFDKIIETFDSIVDIEIVEFLGSLYQPENEIQALPFQIKGGE